MNINTNIVVYLKTDEIVKYNFTNITQSFFKNGVNEKIDSIQHQIEQHNEALKQITSSVSYRLMKKPRLS